MESLPLVSICIACYNAASTIEATLKSVLAQTYANIEIVVNDNQSTDHTAEIVRSFENNRIKLYVNSINIGMVRNFEAALSKTSGEYVKLLCADDLLTPDCIEKEVLVFINHPNDNIVAVTAEKYVINEVGKKLFVKKYPGGKGVHNGLKAIKKSLRYGTNIFGEPGCLLYRKSAILQAGGIVIPDELTYVFDLDLTCRVLKFGNLYVIKEPLFLFRIIASSFTSNSRWKQVSVFDAWVNHIEKKMIHLSWFDKKVAFVSSWLICLARNFVLTVVNKK
ncbi:MAG: glycosyltransferase [Bacteroidales bacterium]|nr:glycosyltransferase [Bacteroidales bacterium]